MPLKNVFYIFCVCLFSFHPVFGQTIMPPEITCVSTDENTGDVTITWELPTDNCGPFEEYILYGATNVNGPYQVIAVITNPNQTEIIHNNANATILNWFYYMETHRDCPGFISMQSDTIQEEELITPEIIYVTVVDNGVEFYWEPSPSTQTEGYIIYEYLGGGFATPFDTIFGRFNTTYFDNDPNRDPNQGSVAYTVATLGCNETSLFSPAFHNTIYLSSVYASCDTEIQLNWNTYKGWEGEQLEYRVMLSEDSVNFNEVTAMSENDSTQSLSLSFISGTEACIIVEAENINSGLVSASNMICITLDIIRPATYLYFRKATVNENDHVELEWYQDGQADITNLSLNHSESTTGFTPIFQQQATPPSPAIGDYLHTDANVNSKDNYYKVATSDACDNELESGTAKTIRLSGEGVDAQNTINWTTFEMEFTTVNAYQIYRYDNGISTPLTSTGASERTFTEFVEGNVTESGGFCYYVVADYNLNLPDIQVNENLTSRSNIFCIEQESIIYMPNAFVPGGVNDKLVPVITFNRHRSYMFQVYDRWGKQIFETSNINVGWDGTASGSDLPAGGYAYIVRLTKEDGKTYERKGTVILVR